MTRLGHTTWPTRALGTGLAAALALTAQAAAPAQLQPPPLSQYVQDVFTDRQGLPQDSVHALLASRRGLLWIGTDEGLARFDGARFTVFDRRSAPALGSNLVYALAEDAEGTLWIGTFDAGLYRLAAGQLTAAPLPSPLPSRRVIALLAEPDGALWIATDAGLARLSGGALTVLGTAQGLPSAEVVGLARETGGRIWVATSEGAAAVEGGRVVEVPPELRGTRVTALAGESDGTIWFATETRGLGRRAAGGGPVLFLGSREGVPGVLHSLLVDRHGALWLGGEGGLGRLRDGRVEQLDLAGGVPALRAMVMVEDREGNLWCGFEGEGLRRFSEGDFTSSGVPEGLPHDVATSVLEDGRRDVWIGTFGGLAVAPGGDLTRLRTVLKGRTAVLGLALDGEGRLVFGQSDGALGRINGGAVTWLSPPTPKQGVLSLVQEPGGPLLVGTVAGLLQFAEGRLEPAALGGLPAGVRVNALAFAPDGALWAGLEQRGAWRRPPGGEFEQVSGPPANRDVNDLLLEADGGAWIATLGAGLWHWQAGQAHRFTTAQGLQDDMIWRVLDDRKGRLWLSSNKGVSAVSRDELLAVAEGRAATVTPATFGTGEGMRSRECNGSLQPAGARTADGRLWFPTVKGVAVVDPHHLRSPVVPPAYLDRTVVDGLDLPAGPALVLPAGTGRLQIAFGAPAFASPGRVRFRYRLAGFDQDWIDAREERVATYTRLPPGQFRFELQARSGDGAWGPKAELELDRRPSLVERSWFWPSLTGLAAALGLLAFALRVRRHRANEAELQRRVDEALGDVQRLEGLLPVCAWCKGVRRDTGYWTRIEAYLQERGHAGVTHALCPDCQAKYFPTSGGDEPPVA
jgi:ligand-binding sensor domain-containing protein